jgi:hypothetical protein
METTLVYKDKVINLSKSTPQEQQAFYDSIIISKEQARAFALELWHSEAFHRYMADIKDKKSE